MKTYNLRVGRNYPVVVGKFVGKAVGAGMVVDMIVGCIVGCCSWLYCWVCCWLCSWSDSSLGWSDVTAAGSSASGADSFSRTFNPNPVQQSYGLRT